MKSRYTIQQLRELGFETVGDAVIFGERQERVAVKAVAGEVQLDPGTFPGSLVRAKIVANTPVPSKVQSARIKNADLSLPS